MISDFGFRISDLKKRHVTRGERLCSAQSAIRNPQSAMASSGFMLVELLMAMFILALGLSAIAAIFPVAGYLQKQTFNDAVGQQVQRNVEAIIGAVSIPDGSLSSVPDTTQITQQRVVAVSGVLGGGTNELPLSMRCYPTALDLDGDGVCNGTNDDPNFIAREFYWVPLFQDTDITTGTHTWIAYVFILAKQPNAIYGTGSGVNSSDPTEVPKVVSATISNVNGYTFTVSVNLQPGDKILCDNGMTPTVTDVSGTTITVDTPLANTIGSPQTIWYAPPATGGQNSPTVAIKAVSFN